MLCALALAAPVGVSAPGFASHLTGNSATYTLDADFDEGTSINVVHSIADQLQLDDETRPFKFIWVAVSSKGTVVKLDTETGDVLGEYASAPLGRGTDPSRTTVDKNGSVWVANRAEYEYVPAEGAYMGSVVHIGLQENGQCEDRNGNGTIDTSSGLGDVLAWTNAGAADDFGGVSTAADECVVHYVRVHATGTRHVSVTEDNDVWVSGTGYPSFDLVEGETGTIVREEPPVWYGGYGGLIDPNGVIWSASPMLRWDTALPLTGPNGVNWTGYGHPSYGLCIDGQGNVWNTEYGDYIRKFAPDGTQLGTFPMGGYSGAQGCVVDGNDDVWIAGSLSGNTVKHLRNDGSIVGEVPVGSGPTGVAVDSAGKIWATNYYDGTVSRIDPALNGGVGGVDLTTGYLGGTLYNYSDMTGSTLIGAPDVGTWTVVHDGGAPGTGWGAVSWNADAVGDGMLTVTAASSPDGTTFGPAQTLASGDPLSVSPGRYLRVSVTFERATTGESPVLYDLTIAPLLSTLVAETAVAEVGPGAWVNYPQVSATLTATASGDPIAGREVDFYTQGRFLCSGTTNSLGVASCGNEIRGINVILGGGYEAVFEGDGTYEGSTDTAPLLRVLGTDVP